MDNGCNASKIKFLSILFFFWSNSYKNMNPTCSLHACRINGQPIKIGGGVLFFFLCFDCMFRCIIHTYSVLMIFHWKIGYMQVDRSLCPLFAEKTKSPAMLILISKLVRIGETIESRHFSATYYSFNYNSAVFNTYLHHFRVKYSFQMPLKGIFRCFFSWSRD